MKINLLFAICFLTFGLLKAQIHPIEYPSGYLSEEKITEILENSRKGGTQEWEIQKANEILHKQLKKQNDAIANGSFGQRIIQPPLINASACVNPGFESNNTTGWTFMSGSNSGSNLPCPTCITTSGAINNVVNASSTIGSQCTTGQDNYGLFPVVAPAPTGGSYSLLLNDNSAGYKMQQANYTFVIDSSNDFFTMQYAIVLQSGGHPLNEEPYFAINITDVTTGSVVPCTYYAQICPTSGTLAGWSISAIDPAVYTKDWTTVGVDLTSHIGHTLTLQCTVSDCDQGGHFGYCYIDASCSVGNFQIIASNALCAGGSTTLSGPSGYSNYNWTGPVTGTSSSIVTSTPGSYTLTTSSAGCADSLYYNLTVSSTTSPTINIQTAQDTVCSGTSVILTATGANTYTWSTSATTNSISVSPTSTITYTVTGIDTTSGCINNTSTATQTIYIENCTAGINQLSVNNNQLNIYPNPNNGSFIIEPNSIKKQTLQVYDVNGKLVLSQTINGKTTIDADTLNEGVYNLSIISNGGVINKRLVIVK
jgi:type IX secretion system substrate protein